MNEEMKLFYVHSRVVSCATLAVGYDLRAQIILRGPAFASSSHGPRDKATVSHPLSSLPLFCGQLIVDTQRCGLGWAGLGVRFMVMIMVYSQCQIILELTYYTKYCRYQIYSYSNSSIKPHVL